MNKPLYLFVGKSASGKTTLANMLESQYGLSQLQSYTTRPKRHENETGHIFITDEEFGNLRNIIAYTKYNGYQYCATKEQIDETSIYVIDVPGVKTLLNKYQNDRPIIILYFETSVTTRIDRMIDRGTSDAEIISRLYTDEKSDWMHKLLALSSQYRKEHGRNVDMFVIDANQNKEDVLSQIEFYINLEESSK